MKNAQPSDLAKAAEEDILEAQALGGPLVEHDLRIFIVRLVALVKRRDDLAVGRAQRA